MATLTMSNELIDLKSRLLAYERDLITAALTATGGNQRRAAQRLGILPTTLHEKMKRLGLRADAFIPGASVESLAAGVAQDPGEDALHS
jgi:DNA-binding NtrC family response regulator